MIIRLAALALVLLGSPALACDRGTVSGRVSHVRDGDTIELGAMAIRLQGLAASLLLTLTTARTAEEPPDLTCVPGYCPSIFQRSTCSGVLLELADEQPTKHAREVYIDLYADVIGPVMDVLLELEEDKRNLIMAYQITFVEEGRKMVRSGDDAWTKACRGLVADEYLIWSR